VFRLGEGPALRAWDGLLHSTFGIVTKPSKYSVADTMDRVEAAAKGIGPLLK